MEAVRVLTFEARRCEFFGAGFFAVPDWLAVEDRSSWLRSLVVERVSSASTAEEASSGTKNKNGIVARLKSKDLRSGIATQRTIAAVTEAL